VAEVATCRVTSHSDVSPPTHQGQELEREIASVPFVRRLIPTDLNTRPLASSARFSRKTRYRAPSYNAHVSRMVKFLKVRALRTADPPPARCSPLSGARIRREAAVARAEWVSNPKWLP